MLKSICLLLSAGYRYQISMVQHGPIRHQLYLMENIFIKNCYFIKKISLQWRNQTLFNNFETKLSLITLNTIFASIVRFDYLKINKSFKIVFIVLFSEWQLFTIQRWVLSLAPLQDLIVVPPFGLLKVVDPLELLTL